jgi:uncharacterized membrane protein YphA (DoxX/SURF4 family)
MRQFGFLTIVFLILLRLSIGWHFLVEGSNKVLSHLRGDTVTSHPFSSGGFFREATGPLGPYFRSQLGDPDANALALLDVQPLKPGADKSKEVARERIPPALLEQWKAWIAAFASHYDLNEQQRKVAHTKLDQEAEKVVRWLEDDKIVEEDIPADKNKGTPEVKKTKEVKKVFPTGDVVRQMAPAERIRAYKSRLAEVRDLVGEENQYLGRTGGRNGVFGKDVAGVAARSARAEATQLRESLLKDLDEFTTELKKSVEDTIVKGHADLEKKGPVPVPEVHDNLYWIDQATVYGLTAIGACLLLGFLTRLNCLLAAAFLLTTFLCAPPFPWLPAAPQSEGTYLFVNKNLIEALALLTLATTRSGRWFGLDGLIVSTWNLVTGHRPENYPPDPTRAAGARRPVPHRGGENPWHWT